jgi:hypothetical protein
LLWARDFWLCVVSVRRKVDVIDRENSPSSGCQLTARLPLVNEARI